MTAIIPSQKSYKIETGNQFPPSIPRQGVKRSRYWYGPYEIRALNVSPIFETSQASHPALTSSDVVQRQAWKRPFWRSRRNRLELYWR